MSRLRTGGSLDSSRLSVAEFSAAVFKRWPIQERPDPRGRPLLLLVCDGSGSLRTPEMRLTKVLAASWLASTARTDVQVLAALYNADQISPGMSGPLVQWIYHPEKTACTSQIEGIRAVVSLPDKGHGGQADAPSLQFLLAEAERISRGRAIYLVLMSDTKWIRSVGGKTGYHEVRAVLEDHMRRLDERFHVTLVALGVGSSTGFEDIVDSVISVSAADLTDRTAVANKIALYVANSMRERRKTISRNRMNEA
jgi:hypothetical protein